MKYLCLVYLSKEKWRACTGAVCFEAAKGLQASGHLLAAETREQLAGFYLLEAKDLNDAIRLATKIPPVRHGSIEVRPVRELDVTGFQSFTPPASELAT
jgi:hypothetical protein